ncbi:MAG: outer membrane lipoprotein-sorting protein [Candidatus Omnitrophica bacterium]|nr:outer membrane lipoprotein-sorting protein [Candidatus Omnitrophota bacterium]
MNTKIAFVAFIVLINFMLVNYSLAALDSEAILNGMKEKYADFYKEVQDITIVQEIEASSPGQDGNMSSEVTMFQKGDKVRMDTKMQMPEDAKMPQGMQQVESTMIYDGETAWMIMPFMGKVKLPETEAFKHQASVNWWDKVLGNADVVGEEVIDGIGCYILKVRNRKTPPFFNRIWISKKDFISVKAEMAGPNGTKNKMVFSDFRELGSNWKFPYRTETYVNDKLISKVTIRSVRINTGLADSIFNADAIAADTSDFGDLMQNVMNKKQ